MHNTTVTETNETEGIRFKVTDTYKAVLLNKDYCTKTRNARYVWKILHSFKPN